MIAVQGMNNVYWYSKLLSLGITPELINASEITSTSYTNLYLKLLPAIKYLNFRVTDPWQLSALTGDITLYEKLSLQKDAWGGNLAHYAAWSGKSAALGWVHAHHPELLTMQDDHGLTITHYAAWSDNSDQFNYSLELTNLAHFAISKNLLQRTILVRGLLNIICKSLDSNYRLTTINLDSEVSEDVISAVGAKSLMKEIDSKLLRNREIERTVNGFKNSFLKGPYQKQYLPGKLPTVKLKQILKLSLPAIPRDSVEQLYHQAKEAAKRETEKVTLQKQGICEFISKECVRLQETMNSYAVSLGFVESSIEKIRALRALSTLVITYEVNEPESLAEKVSQWQEKNRQLIDRQRNKIDVFFRPNHKTLTRKLMEEINQILEVGKAMHLAKP